MEFPTNFCLGGGFLVDLVWGLKNINISPNHTKPVVCTKRKSIAFLTPLVSRTTFFFQILKPKLQ